MDLELRSLGTGLFALALGLASISVAHAQQAGGSGGTLPAAAPAEEGGSSGAPSPALLDPSRATAQAPEKFRVKLQTTEGPVVIEVTRAWSPHGADRLYNLVEIGFFEDIAFFRVIPNFMAQFGIHGDPKVARAWQGASIPDDPVVESNRRGTLTFAKTGAPNSRSTQFFINFRDNRNLDRMGFSPVGEVVEGMEVIDAIHKVGEGAPRGPGPGQGRIRAQGNAYLKQAYPDLDYIESAELVEGASAGPEGSSEE